MKTLKNKLILSYSIISIFIIVAVAWIINLSIDKFFESFAINNRNQQIVRIMEQIDAQYKPQAGNYNIDVSTTHLTLPTISH